MSNRSREAFVIALDSALDWIDANRTTDFSQFTQAQAESLFGTFLDTYTFEIMKTWDAEKIRTIGVPAYG